MVHGNINIEIAQRLTITPFGPNFYVFALSIPDKVRKKIILSSSPFANCQIFTIGNFEDLLFFVEECNEDLFKLIRGMMSMIGLIKPLLQIDVYKEDFDLIKDQIKVYTHHEYRNLTGNQMVSAMLDVRVVSN